MFFCNDVGSPPIRISFMRVGGAEKDQFNGMFHRNRKKTASLWLVGSVRLIPELSEPCSFSRLLDGEMSNGEPGNNIKRAVLKVTFLPQYPVSTKHSYNICTTSDQRLPTLYRCNTSVLCLLGSHSRQQLISGRW